jgi:hypothetical protein
MLMSRKHFNVAMAAALAGIASTGAASADQAPTPAASPAEAKHTGYFYKNPTFEFVFQIALGRAYYCGGNPGKVLWLTRAIADGDYEGAYQALKEAGDEARTIAEDSGASGHKESARQAYLWAQNFYDSATYFLDGSKDPSRFPDAWQRHRDCWIASLSFFDPPIEPVNIPYEGTNLSGFYFHGAGAGEKRPLLILNNGSDGSLLDMWIQGGAAATARGYDCLTFDGPGQGYALWKQKLYFRPDWEKVITPVVDFALTRKEVDPKRIALQGISQGGYWVPRAVAFEKRIAAAIADPGVVDVSTSWTRSLPPPIIALLKDGKKDEFDGVLEKALPPFVRNDLRFRMRPYGFTSYYDTFKATLAYNLTDVAGQIACPMLITSPASESFWPEQSEQLAGLLKAPHKLVPFPVSSGGDLHCEPQAFGLRDVRVFNWLDETMRGA